MDGGDSFTRESGVHGHGAKASTNDGLHRPLRKALLEGKVLEPGVLRLSGQDLRPARAEKERQGKGGRGSLASFHATTPGPSPSTRADSTTRHAKRPNPGVIAQAVVDIPGIFFLQTSCSGSPVKKIKL